MKKLHTRLSKYITIGLLQFRYLDKPNISLYPTNYTRSVLSKRCCRFISSGYFLGKGKCCRKSRNHCPKLLWGRITIYRSVRIGISPCSLSRWWRNWSDSFFRISLFRIYGLIITGRSLFFFDGYGNPHVLSSGCVYHADLSSTLDDFIKIFNKFASWEQQVHLRN